MSSTAQLSSSFEHLAQPVGDQLVSVAAAITSHAAAQPGIGTLVIVVRPDADHHQVLAGGGSGVLRAAMSVAVAGGHDRLWSELPDGETVERSIHALPEVVRAAAEGSDAVAAYAGAIRRDDHVECAAFWFETTDGVASLIDRRHTLELLAAAVDRDAANAEAAAAVAANDRAADDQSTETDSGERQFDPNDPSLDALTGVATEERFTALLDEFDDDEAALVLIDLDDFDALVETHGTEIADRIVRVAADRLVASVRGSDQVARVDTHRFAVLLSDVERSVAMQVSKRLVNAIAEPLELDGGPDSITATVALSHQEGLVDVEEMLELADDAVASGRRSGTGRLVLAV